MNIKFLTFGQGHLVSDKEFARLQKGFAKVGMILYREAELIDADIYMVKGFSHTCDQIPHDKPGMFRVTIHIGSYDRFHLTAAFIISRICYNFISAIAVVT